MLIINRLKKKRKKDAKKVIISIAESKIARTFALAKAKRVGPVRPAPFESSRA